MDEQIKAPESTREGGDPAPIIRKVSPRPQIITPVKVIDQKGPIALVEWLVKDDWHRAYIPASELTPRGVTAEVLDAGEPYGVRWESFVKPLDPQAFARALRQQGIWTVEDLATKPQVAASVIANLSAVQTRQLILAAKESSHG